LEETLRRTELLAVALHAHNGQLQSHLKRLMRHLMPIVTPRLVLRPPTLGDLDSIQAAKENAWNDLQRWMAWAFDNQRSRQALEESIRRTMDFQSQAGIALAGFHKINGDFVVRTALDLTDEADVYETGYWVTPKYAGQGMATEAANAAIRYAFGRLGAKAITIGYFDGNGPSRRIVEKLGFQKLRVARQAATRCLDGTKLDRHEYILRGPDALPELDVSWG
jgi:RimJ/RimL family protein N-acetyltransferase